MPPRPSSPPSKHKGAKVTLGYFISLLAFVGAYWLAHSLYQHWFHTEAAHSFPWATVGVALAVLVGGSLGGWWLGRRSGLGHGHAHVSPLAGMGIWLAVVVAGMGLHWLGTVLEHALLHDWHWSSTLVGLLGFVLNAGAAFVVWRWSRQLSAPQERIAVWNDDVRPRQAVIAFVSSFKGKLERVGGAHIWQLTLEGREPIVVPVTEGLAGIETWEATARTRWNALQLLRGLRPHLGTLKTVHLIASADAPGFPGSTHQVAAIAGFLESVLLHEQPGKGVGFDYHTDPVPFDDVSALYAAIEARFAKEQAKGLRDSQVIVDATSGQKTTSIAAALATLNSKLAFQYVDTNATDRVGVFDWTYAPEAHAPHGPGSHH